MTDYVPQRPGQLNGRSQVLIGLATESHEDSKRWFPKTHADLVHHTLAMCGEAGELANLVKKVHRGDKDINDIKTRHHMAMELTDTFVYLLNIAALLGVDLARSYEQVRALNEERFGK